VLLSKPRRIISLLFYQSARIRILLGKLSQDPDPHEIKMYDDPDPHQVKSRIRICIKEKSRIWIPIKVKIQPLVYFHSTVQMHITKSSLSGPPPPPKRLLGYTVVSFFPAHYVFFSHNLTISESCLFDPWIRDPGLIWRKIRIRDEHPRSFFREVKHIL
jgi:hypothetical protein